MKKKIYLFVLLVMLFVPKVYAFSYELGTELVIKSSGDNSLQDIRVSLKDVQGSDYGIASCTLNIKFSGDVNLNKEVRSLGSWTLTKGKFYLLDTGVGIKKNSDLLIIPVKVSGKGNVNIVDIECFDDQSSKKIKDKVINLTYSKNSNDVDNNNTSNNLNNNNNNNNMSSDSGNNEVNVKDSNCDLSDIILSDGNINFDSSVTEYYIDVDNLDDLVVTPKLVSSKAEFTIIKDDSKILIDVIAEDGSKKAYTIFVDNNVENDTVSDEKINKKEESKNDYTFIFIGIICVLVIINIVRIVVNKRREELD